MDSMGKSAVLSGLLHLAIIVLAIVGLPWFYEPNEVLEATPIAVVSEAQFDQMKDAKKPPAQQKKPEKPPQEAAIPQAPKAPDLPEPVPAPEPQAQPEPPQAAAPPPPAPEPPPPPPPPAPPPQQPEAQDQPQQQAVIAPPPPQTPPPEQPPVVPQEPKVAEAQPKPLPPQKPKPPKKPDTSKKDKPKEDAAEDDTASFLQNVEKKLKKNQAAAQKQQQTPSSPPPQEANLPQQDYNGPPLSEGEKDAIKDQIWPNVLFDPGMQGLEGMIVVVKVVMNPDGSVQSAVLDRTSSNGAANWQIFAEQCERGVRKSSPLRMPPDKPYEAWKEMTLVFHGREMMGM
ncbi:MAG TPA: hypothetical protein VMQ73_02230 [Methylomirabilota bacterium]|nr:hypothetical protein [Methylomirabilota bacterium]